MGPYVDFIEMIFAILLIALILLQARTGGMGSTFGQDSGIFHTRRGAERVIFQITAVVAVLFAALSIVAVRAAH